VARAPAAEECYRQALRLRPEYPKHTTTSPSCSSSGAISTVPNTTTCSRSASARTGRGRGGERRRHDRCLSGALHLIANTADGNGANGVLLDGARGNVLLGNHMHGNGEFDARDNARQFNFWRYSDCSTDFSAGTIC
jgi:parallel beta-helix repeat protein